MLRLLMLSSFILATAARSPAGSLPPPPAGFKAEPASPSIAAMKERGLADRVFAQKPNDNWPGCMTDPQVRLEYGWTNSPGAGQVVEMMASGPEEPATFEQGIRTEPAGKLRYKDGLLIWQKVTYTAAGATSKSCPGNLVVTFSGKWVGFVNGRLLGVSVGRVYGAKAPAQAWLDELIPKVVAAAAN